MSVASKDKKKKKKKAAPKKKQADKKKKLYVCEARYVLRITGAIITATSDKSGVSGGCKGKCPDLQNERDLGGWKC